MFYENKQKTPPGLVQTAKTEQMFWNSLDKYLFTYYYWATNVLEQVQNGGVYVGIAGKIQAACLGRSAAGAAGSAGSDPAIVVCRVRDRAFFTR